MKGQKGKYHDLYMEFRNCLPLVLLTVFLILLVVSVCGTALALELKEDPDLLKNSLRRSNLAVTEPEAMQEPSEPAETLPDPLVFLYGRQISADYNSYSPELGLEALSDEEEEKTAEETIPTEETTSSDKATTSSVNNDVEYVLEASADSRYAGLKLTQDDVDLLIDLLWLEARGEPSEGRQGSAEVVFNRVVNKQYFPDTVYDVVFDTENTVQFPTIYELYKSRPTSGQAAIYLKEIKQALNGPYILPIDVVFFKTEPENSNIWGTIGGHTFCYPWDWHGPSATEETQGS